MKILLKIFLTIIKLGIILFVLAILSYFGMLFYLGYKDGTIYEYKEFKCKNKNLINTIPVSLSPPTNSNIVYLQLDTDDTAIKTYSINNKFKFLSLYSLYDFEGGTFYNYLIEDKEGIKIFVRFDDIDPEKCTFDITDEYWFQNNKEYHPTGNKIKIGKTTRNKVFKSNKGKL